jgi:predicted  nucleic acid-binding Zn-ribbon protein
MKMVDKSTCMVLIAAWILGGCVSMSNDLGDAAYRLDRSADTLSDEVHEVRNSALQREADNFAEVAEDFHGDVQQRMVREELRERFERVADRYHELRDEFQDERPADTRELTAFSDVTRAYLDLERELQVHGSRNYGSRDHRHDY